MSTLRRPSEIIAFEKYLQVAAEKRSCEERAIERQKRLAVEQEIKDYVDGRKSYDALSVSAWFRIEEEQKKAQDKKKKKKCWLLEWLPLYMPFLFIVGGSIFFIEILEKAMS